jgi:hypothetical protein
MCLPLLWGLDTHTYTHTLICCKLLRNLKSALQRAGGVAQAAEHLPSKHKALSSNPITAKKKTRKRKEKVHYIVGHGGTGL